MWNAADIQPSIKLREPNKQKPISLMSCTAKMEEEMVLNHLQWYLSPPHPHTFISTMELGTAKCVMVIQSKIKSLSHCCLPHPH